MHARLVGALAAAAGSFLRTVWRVARQLFHETTGALFVVFALAGGVSAWREWHKGAAPWLIGMAIAFTLLMSAFAVSAFRAARRVR